MCTSSAARQAVILGWDAAVSFAALYAAMLLRFNGEIPFEYIDPLRLAAPLVMVVRLVAVVATRLHRWSFRMSGLPEAVRVVFAMSSASVVFMLLSEALMTLALPRSVYALDFFLALTLVGAGRFAPRIVDAWFADRHRSSCSGTARTIIVGAGSVGDLVARELSRARGGKYFVVGFVDDAPTNRGVRVGGKPVLGAIADLPRLIEQFHVDAVLLAIPRLPAERVRHILRTCASSKVSFKTVPASLAFLDKGSASAMLHDLSPDDLLPRPTVAFDQEEVRQHVAGRRVFVTGAGGTIGGEICKQLAHHHAAQIVMVDMAENELYLHLRGLQQQFPDVDLRAEVADIREASRLRRLAEHYRPEIVFHAAAHKHVPLMEDAPEEAVKNNVFGTLNVALMAAGCEAEQLVFISTDKAVNPSSVMGATKRVGELVVRHVAERSSTLMTAVRFGNVLGSAGSVVPLLKQQIERGGPVTLTHPECTRYFMTISEAVGLVLLAGLSGYGELCVLDMGEPIRIADLAVNLITMAGRIPGKEIPIVYTGLRHGEKLHEELLTEAEEQSRLVRNGINVAKSPPPPSNFAEQLHELAELAEEGDRGRILRALRRLVPTYRSPVRDRAAPELRSVGDGKTAGRLLHRPPGELSQQLGTD